MTEKLDKRAKYEAKIKAQGKIKITPRVYADLIDYVDELCVANNANRGDVLGWMISYFKKELGKSGFDKDIYYQYSDYVLERGLHQDDSLS